MILRRYSSGKWLRLHIDTLRYARPRQLLHRARRLIRSRCPWPGIWYGLDGRVPEIKSGCGADFLAALPFRTSPARHLERAENVRENRFTFLHQTATYHGNVCWRDRRQTRLWRFHLHYFDYAVDLGQAFQAKADPRYWERFKVLVEDWITGNPPTRGDGWHPFTVSLRIVNWTRAFHLFKEAVAVDRSFQRRFLASLYAQAHYLARNLEYDITGNHLVKNGKALIFAGVFFQGKQGLQWFEQGRRILRDEAREQILDDGGHYERSPLYHAQVLADYLDVLALIPEERRERAELGAAVQRMLDFLRAILHPDGSLPLFNDSALWHEPLPVDLFRYAEAILGDQAMVQPPVSGVQSFPNSGYFVFRAADHFVILDCGPVCPDHLPPHAHCDLLSFEFSVGGKRIITNCGTYQYEAGPWRNAFRGTAAHNTVQVDDEEQSAIWDSFRVGRRARVQDAVVRQREVGLHFRGCYIGFESNRIEHRRELFLLPGPCWVFVDAVSSCRGPAPHAVISRLHVHPQAEVLIQSETVHVHRDDIHLQLLPIGGESFGLEQGWFSPDLGVREANACLLLRAPGKLRSYLGFVIAPGQVAVEVIGFQARQEGWYLQLMSGNQEYRLAGSAAISRAAASP
jgi:uncharacterized heparinase superfamily protein